MFAVTSVRSFVFLLSLKIVLLNSVAIWYYLNQRGDTGPPGPSTPLPSSSHTDNYTERDTGRRDIDHSRAKEKHYIAKDFRKVFYNSKNLIYNFDVTNYRPEAHFYSRKLLNTSNSLDNYPKDIFTIAEKKSGYIVLHVIGVCYMFLGLAVVCDEFFVPSLHIISKILHISDDVAGATFMAAGGSAPELFVSIIGVFISKSNVGFGTIVGSAVFNVLFVIGMCAMFSKAVLNLTWWPLLRDSIFYIIALIVLICFFNNQYIEWWEALVLFLIYVCYVIFMVYNAKTERVVKAYLASNTRFFSSVTPMQLKPGNVPTTPPTHLTPNTIHGPILSQFLSSPSDLKKDAYSNGVIQLAIHTLDPIAEDSVEEKFRQMKEHYTIPTNPDNPNMGSDQFRSESSNCHGECDCGRCSTCSSVIRASSPSSPILGKNNSDKNNTNNVSNNIVIENNMKLEDEAEFNHVEPRFQQPIKIEVNNNRNNSNILCETNLDTYNHSSENSMENTKPNDNLHSPYSTGDINLNDLQDCRSDDVRVHDDIDDDDDVALPNHHSDVGNHNNDVKDPRRESSNVVVVRSSHSTSRQFSRNSNRSSRSRGSCHSHRGLFIAAQQRSLDEPDSEAREIKSAASVSTTSLEIEEPQVEEEEEDEDPIDFTFPSSVGGAVYYLIKFPLVFLMSITIPDVRRTEYFGRWTFETWKLFPLSFFMSIIWIAILSYLMAWWASEIGLVSGIDDEIMGLTFLAAGTSIPDLITSVVVARQGHGDMAVSSSIGSNIFDVTVGLPIPWLIKSLIESSSVNVNSEGLFCSTVLLFLMLISIDVTIALNKWKMTKLLGATMFGLYVVFITITLLIQLKFITCPL